MQDRILNFHPVQHRWAAIPDTRQCAHELVRASCEIDQSETNGINN